MTAELPPHERFAWNPKSHQPHRTLTKSQRNRRYLSLVGPYSRAAATILRAAPGILWHFWREKGRPAPLPRPIPATFFGLGTDGSPELLDRLGPDIVDLGAQTVLVRVPAWDLSCLPTSRRFLSDFNGCGIPGTVAVLQDRQSVQAPDRWRDALSQIFEQLGSVAGMFEIGHAWNRLKWGVHSPAQYLSLLATALEFRERDPKLRLAGPAVIDFEYHWTVSVLHHPRHAPRFDAITSLLYVDRRGAPERTQAGFNLQGKIKLLRSVVATSANPSVPLWITETNWPLAAKEGYAPTSKKEAVSLDDYASYQIRYYLLALASGCIDRVYWWQVAAHGYGMIDDIDGQWNRRPAFSAYKTMTRLLKSATLTAVEIQPDVCRLNFSSPAGPSLSVCWTPGPPRLYDPAIPLAALISRDGDELPVPATGRVQLTAAPVYLVHR